MIAQGVDQFIDGSVRSVKLTIDGRADTAVDVLFGHLSDVVHVGLLFSIAFNPTKS